MYTGLSWIPSPRKPAEAKPNLSQLYLSRLSLSKPAKLNFFQTPASDELGAAGPPRNLIFICFVVAAVLLRVGASATTGPTQRASNTMTTFAPSAVNVT